MRKVSLLLTLLVVVTSVYAARVSESDAARVAGNFMNKALAVGSMPSAPRKLLLNMPAKRQENEFFVYETADGEGWVMVASSDLVDPVLAYSPKGKYSPDNQPDNLKKWLEKYNRSVRLAEESLTRADDITAEKWSALRSGANIAAASVVVSPLIRTAWDQSAPYNNLCPYDRDYKERTLTGCVATAMAQVMAYWKYPAKGMDYHSYTHSKYGTLSANFASATYDWDNMLSDYADTYATAAQKRAVATLMYHCGISTEMSYGVSAEGGSGTFVLEEYCQTGTDNAEYAFKNYFGYDIQRSGIKDYSISNKEWIQLLKNDLDNGRPVLYAGTGEGGHCFVCDGYDSQNYFHFNWGWGGYADGYFLLDALEPVPGGAGGGGYTYNDNQMALFGLHPRNVTDEAPDIRLYSDITAPDSVWFFDDLESSVSIANYSETNNVECTIAAVLFDEDGNFFDFVDSVSGVLEAYTYFTYKTTYTGRAAFTPGNYYLAYFYHTDNIGWTLIESDEYDPLKAVRVWYADGIEVYSDFELVSGEFKQWEEVELRLSIANVTGAAFNGSLRVNLANLEDGAWVQNIEVKQGEVLEDGYYRTYIFKGRITADPGTYSLEAAYQREGEDSWYYVGSLYYPNPIKAIVEAQEVLPDPYEENDKQQNAYILKPEFDSSGRCVFDLDDATIHVGTDVDYFEINLPEGYTYTVTPQMFDAMADKGYTLMASAYYFTSINKVSSAFDSNARSFVAKGGETVYFQISPLLAGGEGSYGLKINIQRGEKTPTSLPFLQQNNILVINGVVRSEGDIYVYSYTGRLIRSGQNEMELDDLPRGMYIISANGQTERYMR